MTAIDLVIQRSRAAIDGQFSQERLRVFAMEMVKRLVL